MKLIKLNSRFASPQSSELPARLDSAQTAKLLGFQEHDIPVLVAAKLLKPLGKPVPNSTKWFAACVIEQYAQDANWLNAATQTVYDYWKKKNRAKTPKILLFPNSVAA